VRCSVKYSVYQPPAPSMTEVLAAAAASNRPDSSCSQDILALAAASDCPGSTCSQYPAATAGEIAYHLTTVRAQLQTALPLETCELYVGDALVKKVHVNPFFKEILQRHITHMRTPCTQSLRQLPKSDYRNTSTGSTMHNIGSSKSCFFRQRSHRPTSAHK
jgi:hypothetical protein